MKKELMSSLINVINDGESYKLTLRGNLLLPSSTLSYYQLADTNSFKTKKEAKAIRYKLLEKWHEVQPAYNPDPKTLIND